MLNYTFQTAASAQPADFIVNNLKDFGPKVDSIVPGIYEAYARIFHPAWQVDRKTRLPLRWSEVAKRTNRVAHKQMRWHQIRGEEPVIHDYTKLKPEATWLEAPEEGNLPVDIAKELWQILVKHTAPQSCYFAIWEGFGCLPKIVFNAPRFVTPGREYRLFQGSIEMIEHTFCSNDVDNALGSSRIFIVSASKKSTQAEIDEAFARFDFSDLPTSRQSANFWWPEDEAWCVATEIDSDSTLIDGSKETIEAILVNQALEV